MRTVPVFKNGGNRAVWLPKDIDFEGVTGLEIRRDPGLQPYPYKFRRVPGLVFEDWTE